MAEQQERLMMLKLVTGEQIISLARSVPEASSWFLIQPRLVVDRWHEGRYPMVGGPWVLAIPEDANEQVPLAWKDALLVYYGDNIPGYLRSQYHGAVRR